MVARCRRVWRRGRVPSWVAVRLRPHDGADDLGHVHRVGVDEPTLLLARVGGEQRRDGARPGTLLGAVPGLSQAALAAHAERLDSATIGAAFRLVLKSYEVDAIAPSAEEARRWVRGVNHLPLGGKHRALLALVRKPGQ